MNTHVSAIAAFISALFVWIIIWLYRIISNKIRGKYTIKPFEKKIDDLILTFEGEGFKNNKPIYTIYCSLPPTYDEMDEAVGMIEGGFERVDFSFGGNTYCSYKDGKLDDFIFCTDILKEAAKIIEANGGDVHNTKVTRDMYTQAILNYRNNK